jgi:hypothetical protein
MYVCIGFVDAQNPGTCQWCGDPAATDFDKHLCCGLTRLGVKNGARCRAGAVCDESGAGPDPCVPCGASGQPCCVGGACSGGQACTGASDTSHGTCL